MLPHLKRMEGGKHGAQVLGAHVEGPFINPEKKGAHDAQTMKTFENVLKNYKLKDKCILSKNCFLFDVIFYLGNGFFKGGVQAFRRYLYNNYCAGITQCNSGLQ